MDVNPEENLVASASFNFKFGNVCRYLDEGKEGKKSGKELGLLSAMKMLWTLQKVGENYKIECASYN